MGWAIPGGIKFATTDIFELNDQLRVWREAVVGLSYRRLLSIYADIAMGALDDHHGRGKELIGKPASLAYQEVRDAQREIKKTGYRNPRFDFDFEISILPFEGAIYGTIRCEQNEWIDEFMKAGWATDFHWFDSERPKGIKAAEWKLREKIWRQGIFADGGSPKDKGFNAELTTSEWNIPRITVVEIAEEIAKTPFEKRVRRVAKDVLMNEVVSKDEEYQAQKDDPGTQTFMAAFFRYNDWLKTDEGQAELAVVEARIAPKLIPVIMPDVL